MTDVTKTETMSDDAMIEQLVSTWYRDAKPPFSTWSDVNQRDGRALLAKARALLCPPSDQPAAAEARGRRQAFEYVRSQARRWKAECVRDLKDDEACAFEQVMVYAEEQRDACGPGAKRMDPYDAAGVDDFPAPKEEAQPAEQHSSEDKVRMAMEDACRKYGGTGDQANVFNLANLSGALMGKAGLHGGVDGRLCRVILSGRRDVEQFGPSDCYYRMLPAEQPAPALAVEPDARLRLVAFGRSQNPPWIEYNLTSDNALAFAAAEVELATALAVEPLSERDTAEVVTEWAEATGCNDVLVSHAFKLARMAVERQRAKAKPAQLAVEPLSEADKEEILRRWRNGVGGPARATEDLIELAAECQRAKIRPATLPTVEELLDVMIAASSQRQWTWRTVAEAVLARIGAQPVATKGTK